MKEKLKWNQRKKASRLVPNEEKAPYIERIKPLKLDPNTIGEVSIENIDNLLMVLEEYYSQFGLVQICLEMRGYGDSPHDADLYEIDIDVECEEDMGVRTDTHIYLNHLGCGMTIYRSDEFHREPDNYKKAAAFGRKVYFALRKKHPLLTRDLGEPCGANTRAPKYEIVCEKCGRVLYRARKCKITEHPERFRCSCGGKLFLKKNADVTEKVAKDQE